MKPFHYHEDPMYAAAAAILASQTVTEEATLLDEGVEDIAIAVANFKKGDKTNFGVVTDVTANSISFKAKDLPVTKIAFNQRKIGSKDFVLDKLVKLKEDVALDEGVEDIAAAVKDFKKGDKTNFGVVTDVGTNSISFKAKDLPVTKIAFNQRKMGSKDFVLDKLVKLKEGVSLEEGYGMGTATITAPGNKLHGKQVSIFHKFDDGRLNVQYAKSDKKGDVLNLTLKKDQYKLD